MHDRLFFIFALPHKCVPVSHGTGVKIPRIQWRAPTQDIMVGDFVVLTEDLWEDPDKFRKY